MGKQSMTLYGKDKITDQLSETIFEISDQSFYQINSVQTEKLYQKAIDYAQLSGNEIVLDTYCGIGTIGLYMAQWLNMYMVSKLCHQPLKMPSKML